MAKLKLKAHIKAFALAKSKKAVWVDSTKVTAVEKGESKGTSEISVNGDTLVVAGGPALTMKVLGWTQ
jgi:hypothetical protein